MNTFNRIWTILAIVLMVLPFAAVGYELAKSESPFTIAVFIAMGLLLFGTLVVGMRVKPASPGNPQDQDTDEESVTARSSVETRR